MFIDIAAPKGINVVAAASGKVVTSGWNNSYGYQVIIDHGGGILSLYAHNSRLLVNVGQKVEKGQIISQIGSTGLSTGAHLHFGVSKNGDWIDPTSMLK